MVIKYKYAAKKGASVMGKIWAYNRPVWQKVWPENGLYC
jgi:hypothetical protein